VLTAVTIACDAVDDEVTLMISRDGTAKCTGYQRYGQPDKDSARLIRARGRRSGKKLGCEGLGCRRIVEYRAGLDGEGKP
jgi:hypothetical protein